MWVLFPFSTRSKQNNFAVTEDVQVSAQKSVVYYWSRQHRSNPWSYKVQILQTRKYAWECLKSWSILEEIMSGENKHQRWRRMVYLQFELKKRDWTRVRKHYPFALEKTAKKAFLVWGPFSQEIFWKFTLILKNLRAADERLAFSRTESV